MAGAEQAPVSCGGLFTFTGSPPVDAVTHEPLMPEPGNQELPRDLERSPQRLKPAIFGYQISMKVWVYYNSAISEASIHEHEPPVGFGGQGYAVGPIELGGDLVNDYRVAKEAWHDAHLHFVAAVREAQELDEIDWDSCLLETSSAGIRAGGYGT